jgi:hypothetical protein
MNNENTEINNAVNSVIVAITKYVIEQIEPRLVALEHKYKDQTTESIKELIEECLTNTIEDRINDCDIESKVDDCVQDLDMERLAERAIEDAIESHDFKSSINDAIFNSTISIKLS